MLYSSFCFWQQLRFTTDFFQSKSGHELEARANEGSTKTWFCSDFNFVPLSRKRTYPQARLFSRSLYLFKYKELL